MRARGILLQRGREARAVRSLFTFSLAAVPRITNTPPSGRTTTNALAGIPSNAGPAATLLVGMTNPSKIRRDGSPEKASTIVGPEA